MNTFSRLGGVIGLISGATVVVGMTTYVLIQGNPDLVDTEKSFPIAIDENEETISIACITGYNYDGSQVQFVTQDGLVVLTSTKNTHLLKQDDKDLVEEYALALANGDESMIYHYNNLEEMQDYGWNKNFFDLNYTYDYALIQSEEGIIIAEVDEWKDYEDDKIQISLTNGTTILKDVEDVKLVNSSNAPSDSLYNYALSLVGDESKIQNYSMTRKLTK